MYTIAARALLACLVPVSLVYAGFSYIEVFNSSTSDCSEKPQVVLATRDTAVCGSTKPLCIHGALYGCDDDNTVITHVEKKFGEDSTYIGKTVFTDWMCSKELLNVGVWVIGTGGCVNGLSASYKANVSDADGALTVYSGMNCSGTSVVYGPTGHCNNETKIGVVIVNKGVVISTGIRHAAKERAMMMITMMPLFALIHVFLM
jgi:hypothetical protein